MYDEVPLPPRPSLPTALWCLVDACVCERLVLGAARQASEEVLLGVGIGLLVVALPLVLLAIRAPTDGGHHHRMRPNMYRTSRKRSFWASVLAGWLADAELAARPPGTFCRNAVLRMACSLAAVGLLASSATAVRGAYQQHCTAQLSSSAVSAWEFEVLGDASSSTYGWRCRARAQGPRGSVGNVWLSSRDELLRGRKITCVGRFKQLSDDDYGQSSWLQGICGSVTVLRVKSAADGTGPLWMLELLREKVIATIEPDKSAFRALLAGCICGYRRSLDQSGLLDEFTRCGLAHMVAVSGAHLALVATAVVWLLEGLSLTPSVRLPLLTLVTGLFVAFCGAPVSAVRAWLMSLVAAGAQLGGRRNHALSSVSVVALLMALGNPTLPGQLGYLLSVMSVTGLCVFSPHANYLLKCVLRLHLPRWLSDRQRRVLFKGLDALRSTLAATLVCQVVTLPVTSEAFGRIALIAPVSNVLFAPLLGVLLPVGLVLGLLWWLPGVGGLILALGDYVGSIPLDVLHGLSRTPWASVSTSMSALPIGPLTAALLLVWYFTWPKARVRQTAAAAMAFVAASAVCVLAWRYGAPARIVVLDVGQGDAILVQDHGSAVLVDTGPDDAVVDALARQHVLHLDAVVLTHLHDDHFTGLFSLDGAVSCDVVLVAKGVAPHVEGDLLKSCQELTGTTPQELAYGSVLHVGGFDLRMIWPQQEVDGYENSESLQLLVTYQQRNRSLVVLLTGDAEQDELAACLQSGEVGDIDLLKVGHHGSEVSLTREEAQALDPELAVASAGEANRYGHPAPECVAVLEDAGAVFLCTKDVGDVEVRPAERGLQVKTFPLTDHD